MTKQDKAYLAAVSNGDLESARAIFDEMARASNVAVLYHVGKMETPELRASGVTGGNGEVYLTLQPEVWRDSLERDGESVTRWLLPKARIADSPPSRRELVDWAVSKGYMEYAPVIKPDGTRVLHTSGEPVVAPTETEAGRKLPFYETQDPFRGGNQFKHITYAFLGEQGLAALESAYSPDGHEVAVFNPTQITPGEVVMYDEYGHTELPSERIKACGDKGLAGLGEWAIGKQFVSMGSYGPSDFQGDVSADVHRLIEEYGIPADDINGGNCDNFAFDLVDRVGGEVIATTDDSQLPSHYFVRHEGKLYDAQTPDGAASYSAMSIFAPHLTCSIDQEAKTAFQEVDFD